MTHLQDIFYLMERFDNSLDPDSNIQIVEQGTGAHFRRDWENYTITLGGDYYCNSFTELMDLVVFSISFNDGVLTFEVMT